MLGCVSVWVHYPFTSAYSRITGQGVLTIPGMLKGGCPVFVLEQFSQ